MGINTFYDSAAKAEADRTHLRSLLGALDAGDRALRRDACGAWSIVGSRGCICTMGDGASWVLSVACRSAKHWTWTKKQLSFCAVLLDGDEEGGFKLHSLPDRWQAAVIREILGIRKRTVFSTDELERRKTSMAQARSAQRLAKFDSADGWVAGRQSWQKNCL